MEEIYEKAINLLKENEAKILKLEIKLPRSNVKDVALFLDLSKIKMKERKGISTEFLSIFDFDKDKLKEFCKSYPELINKFTSKDYVKKIPLLMKERVML